MKLQRRKGQKGQSLVEYALVLVLVAVVAISILTVLGQAVRRPVAVVAGNLGAQRNGANTTSGTNNIYASAPIAGVGKADCALIPMSSPPRYRVQTVVTVSSDITWADISASTDGSVGSFSGTGTGTTLLQVDIFVGHSCPNSLVLQAHSAIAIIPVVAG